MKQRHSSAVRSFGRIKFFHINICSFVSSQWYLKHVLPNADTQVNMPSIL